MHLEHDGRPQGNLKQDGYSLPNRNADTSPRQRLRTLLLSPKQTKRRSNWNISSLTVYGTQQERCLANLAVTFSRWPGSWATVPFSSRSATRTRKLNPLSEPSRSWPVTIVGTIR